MDELFNMGLALLDSGTLEPVLIAVGLPAVAGVAVMVRKVRAAKKTGEEVTKKFGFF
tara:strand:+ start:108 stop:278 length:171 start_codon:yes stop_codon:yes gene_type:complete